jgi:putative MATE family efflux protein
LTEEQAHIQQQGDRKSIKGTDAQFNRLGTERIGKLLFEFGIPAIAGLIINGLYNILTAVFLGWGAGDVGLAVATVANPMMIFFMSLGMLVGNGGNALAAIRLGEGNKPEAERVLGNTVLLALIAWALTVFVAFVFPDPILAISGATEETHDLARTFLQILSLGSIFQIIGFGVNNFIRTAGDPRRALWTLAIGAIACTVLSYLFVIVLGWGVPGQAAATVLGQAVSCFSVVHYFVLSKKSPFKLKRTNLPFRSKTPLRILALGSASFFTQFATAIMSFVLNNQTVIYGSISSIGDTGAFAIFAVIQRVALFVMFPVMGIVIAGQPILGYCYGARIAHRVRKTLRLQLIVGIIICLVMWVVIEVFTAPICTAFGIQGDLLAFCVTALRMQTILMPLMVVQIVIAQYYQATGRPTRSIILSLTRQFIFLIPLYFALPVFVGAFIPSLEQLHGLILGPPVADFLSFLLAGTFTIIEFRRLGAVVRAQEAGEDVNWGSGAGKKRGGRKAEEAKA